MDYQELKKAFERREHHPLTLHEASRLLQVILGKVFMVKHNKLANTQPFHNLLITTWLWFDDAGNLLLQLDVDFSANVPAFQQEAVTAGMKGFIVRHDERNSSDHFRAMELEGNTVKLRSKPQYFPRSKVANAVKSFQIRAGKEMSGVFSEFANILESQAEHNPQN